MGAQVLTDIQLLLGSVDVTNFSGEFACPVQAEMKTANHFGGRGYQIVLPGLTSAQGMLKGNSDMATVGIGQFLQVADIGTQQAFGIVSTGSAAVGGDSAQFMQGRLSKIAPYTNAVGEVAGFEIVLDSDSADVNGYVGAPLASRTTAGLTGLSVQMGAVPTGRRLWCAQFVTAAAGTNLATIIQSDNATGFPSAATALTLSTVSAVGWQFTSVAGPITDDWFRVVSTIATSTFSYAVLFGIQ